MSTSCICAHICHLLNYFGVQPIESNFLSCVQTCEEASVENQDLNYGLILFQTCSPAKSGADGHERADRDEPPGHVSRQRIRLRHRRRRRRSADEESFHDADSSLQKLDLRKAGMKSLSLAWLFINELRGSFDDVSNKSLTANVNGQPFLYKHCAHLSIYFLFFGQYSSHWMDGIVQSTLKLLCIVLTVDLHGKVLLSGSILN